MAFEEERVPKETKDTTKYWWFAVIALLILAVPLLYMAARPNPNVSRVRARHILIPFQQGDPVSRARARDDVERILRQLEQNPERFDELAREYSDDAVSASRGGDLGWVQKGEFEDEFESYVWTAPLGETSEPIRTRHGFHIIEVLDRYISEADRYELELKERAMQPRSAPDTGDGEAE